MRLQLLLRDIGFFLIGASILIMLVGAFVLAVWTGTWPVLVAAVLCYVSFLIGKGVLR